MRALAIIASLGISLGTAMTAHADTVMATPIYLIGAGGTTCNATNVGKKTVTVAIQVIKYSLTGDVLQQSTQDVEPNGTVGQGASPAEATFVYCRFSGKFSKSSLRVGGFVSVTSATVPGY
jgi:hypothetical protein